MKIAATSPPRPVSGNVWVNVTGRSRFTKTYIFILTRPSFSNKEYINNVIWHKQGSEFQESRINTLYFVNCLISCVDFYPVPVWTYFLLKKCVGDWHSLYWVVGGWLKESWSWAATKLSGFNSKLSIWLTNNSAHNLLVSVLNWIPCRPFWPQEYIWLWLLMWKISTLTKLSWLAQD